MIRPELLREYFRSPSPGALITLLTGRSAVFSGTRQLVFGLLAAGLTFGLGRLIGTVVGG